MLDLEVEVRHPPVAPPRRRHVGRVLGGVLDPVAVLVLVHDGQKLDKARTLADCGIGKEAELTSMLGQGVRVVELNAVSSTHLTLPTQA